MGLNPESLFGRENSAGRFLRRFSGWRQAQLPRNKFGAKPQSLPAAAAEAPSKHPAFINASMLFWLVLMLALAQPVLAGKIGHKLVALGLQDNALLLDLVEDYELNDTVLEALNSGVPLTFATQFELRDDNSHFWQAGLKLKFKRILSYQPLAEQYEVYKLDTGERAQFATLDAALYALGDFRSQQVAKSSYLRPGSSYQISIQTELMIAALPLPMRPMAYLTPSWYLSSPVYEWQLNP